MNQIIGVAVIYNGTLYSLPAPNRHHNVIRSIGGIYGSSKEGFIDDESKFLTRTEAMLLAKQNGQLNRREGVEYYQGPELFSEDLW